MKPLKQRRDVQVRQDSIGYPQKTTMAFSETAPFIAQVTVVYSQRMTCDLKTSDGQILQNIPIKTQAGLIEGKPYGEVCLPAVDDYVIVIYASFGTRHKIVIGTIIPYLSSEFAQAPVNSSSKQFATKLLEADIPLEYRRIFKSGTSVQVKEDGTIIVETPSGRYIQIDEDAGKLVLSANGNTISMETGKVVINGNMEVLQ